MLSESSDVDGVHCAPGHYHLSEILRLLIVFVICLTGLKLGVFGLPV
jgi:hypothetical protein